VKRKPLRRTVALVGIAWLTATGSDAFATDGAQPSGSSSGGAYRIDAMTIDAGGGRSAAAVLVVDGTLGQADADPLQPSSGGSFSVVGGFWPAAMPAGSDDRLFADGFETAPAAALVAAPSAR
jgi:hypothetical protein